MTADIAGLLLAAVFLLAIPLNVYVVAEVRKLAEMPPAIDILTLLSGMVQIFATAAIVLAIIVSTSVAFLITGFRILPVPLPTIALIVVLLIISFANLLVLQYLRRKKAQWPQGGDS